MLLENIPGAIGSTDSAVLPKVLLKVKPTYIEGTGDPSKVDILDVSSVQSVIAESIHLNLLSIALSTMKTFLYVLEHPLIHL